MIALFVCKCLNVSLESDKVEEITDIGKLELTSPEQRDIFFSEKLVSSPVSALRIHVVQPALVGQRTVGHWLVNSCLACGHATHAMTHDQPDLVVLSKSSLTSPDRVNVLKKSKNFSPVFNLLVPEVTSDIDMKENIDTSNVLKRESKGWPPAQQVISTLNKQLNQTLQSQLENVEDAVRQFRDQKYAEFEAYRERAHRDHKILASIIAKTRHTSDSEGWRVEPSQDAGPPSPQLPPLQRRRLSSIKDAKKMTQLAKPVRNLPPEEDSLEAEDVFDLDSSDFRHNMASDQEDYDSDPEGSRDEGIQVSRRSTPCVIARSAPINMPNFPMDREQRHDLDDHEEPTDIAASIKALARSVHGDTFELPRPRFSTQI